MNEDSQTPADYIAAQKQARPSRSITLEQAQQALADFDIAESGGIASALERFNSIDYAEKLLDGVAERLPDYVHRLLGSGAIALGEVDDPHFGAHAVFPNGGGCAIIISRGTHQFIYRIARILSTLFVIEGAEAQAQLSFEDTARMIAEAFWWFEETGQAFGPEYPVSVEQRLMASDLTTHAMTFILCHELGHAATNLGASDEYLAQVQSWPHLDEFNADSLGATWTLGIGSKEPPQTFDEMGWRFAGVEFVLQIWALRGRFVEYDDSHPTSQERIGRIRHMVREHCDDSTWMALTADARGIERLFQAIGELLDDPVQHQQFFQDQANSVLSELDTLLERCAATTANPVPDYVTFYSEAGRIFARGYPTTLLERIAKVAPEAFPDDENAWPIDPVRASKFKLLVQYLSEHVNEPARSIFLQALVGPPS